MYLKNTSSKVCIVVNTVVGRFTIKPKEIVDLKHKLLPPISKTLIQVTEEEYLQFRSGKSNNTPEVKKEVKQSNPETEPTVNSVDSTAVVNNIAEQEPVNKIQTDVDVKDIMEQVSQNITDNNVMDFVEKLLILNQMNLEQEEIEEIIEQEPVEEVNVQNLEVVETDSTNELKELNGQLKNLKTVWKQAKTPKRKDKIQKQIKELQKQIAKLNKDLS